MFQSNISFEGGPTTLQLLHEMWSTEHCCCCEPASCCPQLPMGDCGQHELDQ